jgi:adenylate kinase family enzyme
VHLDRIFWRSNWVQATAEEFQADLAAELRHDAWIIDGNYGRTVALRLQRADTAILLDFPRWLCLWRALKRSVTGWGRPRPDMGEECAEKLDLPFLRFIWRFRREQRPDLLAQLDCFSGKKIVLRSPAKVRQFLASLASGAAVEA